MRSAAEEPDEGRAFQPPTVPDFVVPEVGVGEESEGAFVEASLRLEAGQDFVLVALPVRFNQFLQGLLHLLLLILGHVGDRKAGEFSLLPLKADGLFGGKSL